MKETPHDDKYRILYTLQGTTRKALSVRKWVGREQPERKREKRRKGA